MSLMSRMSASGAGHETAELVAALLRDPQRPGNPDLLAGAPRAAVPSTSRPGALGGPTGLGTSAARVLLPARATTPARVGAPDRSEAGPRARVLPRIPVAPAGPGAASAGAGSDDTSVPVLYCPPAVRDDPALGEEVDDRLVEWAAEVGIYPGQLDRVRSAGFGRLIMLAHPETDDPDRLLAAAKCALSEWSVDDHYVDGEAEEARPELLGQRLAIAHSVIDQAHLPVAYAPRLEEVVRADPVMVALRDALRNLGGYASHAQARRLRHELAIMFVAYNQEAVWATSGHRPPVWEFLMHRHENSFVPCMVLIDTLAGYELSQAEFSDPRVRRVFTLAGSASVIVNDLYSMGKEDPSDFSLPRLIETEEGCSSREAVERSVLLHDEIMHTYEAEAAALALTGSPELRRFLAGVWAWLGGSREWHARTARYHGVTD
ncbi:family 2 encapsulin nanocompartment cargo protein terpene cyclase [Nocardiopsis sp. MG754419]|uniref:family 2 encapsulin nanocompartment cargo protein terpene cyclase n=1 Tax=Nocardiopsis sp. MG754419 TaxID=2259865 RepID=UPI001BA7FEC5|nr:family 2 encapsulin nanocompartment cargo protein terpene cyclase [Nocardiopsis sp. MG754419]MBR8745097.1 terpene synthase [Nocardiopsis sp. MG754419]